MHFLTVDDVLLAAFQHDQNLLGVMRVQREGRSRRVLNEADLNVVAQDELRHDAFLFDKGREGEVVDVINELLFYRPWCVSSVSFDFSDDFPTFPRLICKLKRRSAANHLLPIGCFVD